MKGGRIEELKNGLIFPSYECHLIDLLTLPPFFILDWGKAFFAPEFL